MEILRCTQDDWARKSSRAERCGEPFDFPKRIASHFLAGRRSASKSPSSSALQPLGQPAGTLLGVAGLEAAEESAGGLAHAFAGA